MPVPEQSGDGPDKQMIDTAGAVADFAYRQGVGDALAVDHLIQKYRVQRAEVERLREERDEAWREGYEAAVAMVRTAAAITRAGALGGVVRTLERCRDDAEAKAREDGS